MRIGSLKLGERIIKDEKMVVCQKLFQAAYLPLWRIALLLFHLLYNCFPVFRLPQPNRQPETPNPHPTLFQAAIFAKPATVGALAARQHLGNPSSPVERTIWR